MSPVDRTRYPANWKQIRAAILLREGYRCQTCRVPDQAVVVRGAQPYRDYWAAFLWEAGCRATADPCDDNWHDGAGVVQSWHAGDQPWDGSGETIVTIVLTIAHLDHDTAHNDPANLASLCQLHHLRLDVKLHARHAATTRRQRTGQLTLLEDA